LFNARLFHTILFFSNDTPTTAIYTLSLHDALPIYSMPKGFFTQSACVLLSQATSLDAIVPLLSEFSIAKRVDQSTEPNLGGPALDRKSTRLNSSHVAISYAVFCLKKKNNTNSKFGA